jgi:hypothetical protein
LSALERPVTCNFDDDDNGDDDEMYLDDREKDIVDMDCHAEYVLSNS